MQYYPNTVCIHEIIIQKKSTLLTVKAGMSGLIDKSCYDIYVFVDYSKQEAEVSFNVVW